MVRRNGKIVSLDPDPDLIGPPGEDFDLDKMSRRLDMWLVRHGLAIDEKNFGKIGLREKPNQTGGKP